MVKRIINNLIRIAVSIGLNYTVFHIPYDPLHGSLGTHNMYDLALALIIQDLSHPSLHINVLIVAAGYND